MHSIHNATMIPIHEVLNRIRWDPEFGKGRFTIGYYDRIDNRVINVAMQDIRFDPENHFGFEFTDDEGETHSVPLHRIRDVYKDGVCIWHREGHPT